MGTDVYWARKAEKHLEYSEQKNCTGSCGTWENCVDAVCCSWGMLLSGRQVIKMSDRFRGWRNRLPMNGRFNERRGKEWGRVKGSY